MGIVSLWLPFPSSALMLAIWLSFSLKNILLYLWFRKFRATWVLLDFTDYARYWLKGLPDGRYILKYMIVSWYIFLDSFSMIYILAWYISQKYTWYIFKFNKQNSKSNHQKNLKFAHFQLWIFAKKIISVYFKLFMKNFWKFDETHTVEKKIIKKKVFHFIFPTQSNCFSMAKVLFELWFSAHVIFPIWREWKHYKNEHSKPY